jgi:hypothetical protein
MLSERKMQLEKEMQVRPVSLCDIVAVLVVLGAGFCSSSDTPKTARQAGWTPSRRQKAAAADTAQAQLTDPACQLSTTACTGRLMSMRLPKVLPELALLLYMWPAVGDAGPHRG